MASTAINPNNAKIAFRGKTENEKMPVVSKAQNAAMHAAANGKSTLGIPKKVGADFVKDQAPGSVKKLPQRVPKKKKKAKAPKSDMDRKVDALRRSGMISDKAAAKLPNR